MLLRLDRRGRLRFAALQGESAQEYLRSHDLPTGDFDSLVFVPDWSQRERRDFLLRTDGVIAALRQVGGFGSALAWLRVVPAVWRDAAYRLIARWRYRFFGQWQPKPLPRPEWAARFLQ
jgi:predicted DCC family thiol-disulfide oxidoreductase YuxK